MPEYPALPNAPLIEVIAEIHWALSASAALPEQQVQKDWFKMAFELDAPFRRRWPYVEDVRQAGFTIPLDVIGRAPLLRFREQVATWPLTQLGQGLLTVNATPPYDGWRRVRQTLREAVELATTSETLRNQKIERLQLHYRDGFTSAHGVEGPTAFTGSIPLASERMAVALGDMVVPDSASFSGETSFGVATPKNARAVVRYMPGTLNTPNGAAPAGIVDFIVSGPVSIPWDVNLILAWFDQAHECSHQLFRNAVSQNVWERINAVA